MTKVSILEGQTSKHFSGVDYLRTDKQGGGTIDWVPENARKLLTKTIDQNGTYYAENEKDNNGKKTYYAYEKVTVNITKSGRVTGKKPVSGGGDGNEYSVDTDDSGNLVETVLPSSINIVGLPTKTNYSNGEAINKAGMVVKAYLADGTLYNYSGYQNGAIPLSELSINPTVANISSNENTVYPEYSHQTSELMTITSVGSLYSATRLAISYIQPSYEDENNVINSILAFAETYDNVPGEVVCIVYSGNYSGFSPLFVKAYTSMEIGDTFYVGRGQHTYKYAWTSAEQHGNNPWVYNGYADGTGNDSVDFIGYNYNGNEIKISTINAVTHQENNQITVSWNRPEDEKTLTDKFEIEVG